MLKTFTASLRRLSADIRGGTLIIFAVAAPILAVLVLGVIDLYRISVVKQQLQDSLDAATLMVARSSAKNDKEADAVGDKAFQEMIAKLDVGAPVSNFKMGKDDDVIGSASGYLKPMIVGLFSGGKLTATTETVVKRAAGSPVELVLVLDTTASMDGQPLKDLKVAAKDLVQKLHQDVKTPGLVKIGVAPFGQYVNVGISRRNESWMKVAADYSETIQPACYLKTETTTCQTQTYSCTKYNDGKPYQTTCSNNVNCVTTKLNPAQQICPAAYTVNHKFWGCVGSPAYPKNVNDTDASRVYPGYLDLKCGSEITPLTSNQGQVISAIETLSANGYTYIPSGLAWGFNMLSPPKPMVEAAAYDKTGQNAQPRKALVLMTDGENTMLMNHSNGRHDKSPSSGSPAKEANDYTEELCKNIKAQKIEVFTVAFQVTNNQIKKILQECASDSDHYFDAGDAPKLQAAFSAIATSLRNLYIAK